MIVRLLAISFLAAWSAAHFDSRISVGAETPSRETLETDKLFANAIADRNNQWDSLLKDVGKVKEGLGLSARLSSESITVGEKLQIDLCIKNVTELPSSYGYDRYNPTVPFVLVRDQDGKPARLTASGLHRAFPDAYMSSGTNVPLLPGDGFNTSYPLSSDFALENPGKYSVLVGWHGSAGGVIVAKRLEFTLWSKDANGAGKARSTTPPVTAPEAIVNPAPGMDEEWSTLLKAAGKESNGCILTGVLSPYSPDAVHLVLSITCVRDMNPPAPWYQYHESGCKVKLGSVPSNYRILIHDSAGKRAPMTPFGREFFQRRYEEYSRSVRVGHSIGTWLPLDELFCLRSGEAYAVVAAIPEKPGSLAGLVSPAITFRAPQFSIAGLTRPLYGSDELWPKLVARASVRDPILASECKIVYSNEPFGPDGEPQIMLRKRSGETFGLELKSAETTVLVRDHRGTPTFPLAIIDPRDEYDKWPGAAERARAKRWMDTTPFEPLDRRVESPAGTKAIVTYPRFPYRYLIIPGEPYTIVVAVRMRGDHPSFVVLGPLTYALPSQGDYRSFDSRSHEPLPTPAYKPAPPIHMQWDSLVRFAGKPFHDLVLTASEDKRGELKVALANQGKQSLLIKTWDGIAGYDVQVRNADGKPVSLTEKGKALFQGGTALDARELKPQERIEATVPVVDLFDMHVHGTYTVLASLPVIGEVDAVLTATPIKIQLGNASVPRGPGS